MFSATPVRRQGLTLMQGFTLIEVLVVIAIIGTLAAILFPVFARSREKARQTACLSNNKQIGLAFQQYSQDYDERYPAGDDVRYSYRGGWAGRIYPYIKSAAVFTCPDDTHQATGPGVSLSYAMNAFLVSVPDPITGIPVTTRTVPQFSEPSRLLCLLEVTGQTVNVADPAEAGNFRSPEDAGGNFVYADSSGNGGCCDSTWRYQTGPMASGTHGNGQDGPARHGDGSNILLADGHAKWFRSAQVDDNSSHTGALCPVSVCSGP